jgi:hypothetical protein
MLTGVSEERMTSIVKIESQPRKKPMCSRWLGGIVQGALSQKMVTIIATTVRSSNQTYSFTSK